MSSSKDNTKLIIALSFMALWVLAEVLNGLKILSLSEASQTRLMDMLYFIILNYFLGTNAGEKIREFLSKK